MSRSKTRHEQLAEAYAALRHPVWAWLQVYGGSEGAWGKAPAAARRRKASSAAGHPVAEKAAADQAALFFAAIEAKAHVAFLARDVRDHLRRRNVAPPDPPGSGTHAALLADLETLRLGALRAGDWREARAAVMDKAKLCTMTASAHDKEAPPDERPIDDAIEDAFAILSSYRNRRDTITAAVEADRARDRAGARGGEAAVLAIQPPASLP